MVTRPTVGGDTELQFLQTPMIYTSIAHQIASGPKAVARIASAMGPANGTSQTAVTINLQKIF